MKKACLLATLLVAVPALAQAVPTPEPAADVLLLAAGVAGACFMAVRAWKK